MKKPETIPGRPNTRGLAGLGKAAKTGEPSAPREDPTKKKSKPVIIISDPTEKKKKKKKINTITVGGDSGVQVLEIGHKNPEGLKDAKKIKGKPHSSPEGRFFSKMRTRPLTVKYNKGGRANFRGGGRTNLLEELGRVEGEPSNRNRRAEISRVHGELNRGYKKGGRTGLSHGGSAGPVLKNKKVGIQIK